MTLKFWRTGVVLLVFLAVSGCGPEAIATIDEGGPVDDASSASELGVCRDLSANYRVSTGCGLGGGHAPAGTIVTVTQSPGCSAQITFSATVWFEQMWNPMPPRFSGPYDRCALARFDAGSHGGVAQINPAWECDKPLPPLPPPLARAVSVTVDRSKVKDWTSRVDMGGCALFQSGPSTATSAPAPSAPTGPTAKLARSTFLRTATLGYGDFLTAGTVVGLPARPASVAAQNSFTWVSVGSKTGFVSSYDLGR